jgi:hypothetical protein
VDSVSAEVRFFLSRDSSFSASVISTSGQLKDALGVALRRKEGASEGSWAEGRYGGGEGLIECETFSGDISFSAP